MLLRTTHSMRYPARVRKLLRKVGDAVKQGDIIFEFEYMTKVTEGNDDKVMVQVEKLTIAKYQSEATGIIKHWNIHEGDKLERVGHPVCEVEEPCSHQIQYAGICANCGADMEAINYNTTIKDASRAPVRIAHGSSELKVSESEAQHTSEAAMRRLLKSRKLSLVVDLDQTIIHAVCDPTVADWKRDETSPNHEAVKDVESFELMDEARPGQNPRPCSYYIKMRPGLKAFLDKMSDKYECHIYTMGTRSYAQNVAKIVDPDGKIFGDRILSRDESGSMTVKNLHRLFPVDTKMVVIIDDRADVWRYSPNLVRVKAFTFYVGIGDINSSFLPKLPDTFTTAPSPAIKQVSENGATKESENGDSSSDVTPEAAPESIEESLVLMAGGNVEEKNVQHAQDIAAQVEDRPLLKQQQALEQEEEEIKSLSQSTSSSESEEMATNGDSSSADSPASSRSSAPSVQEHPHYRHPLLRDDDDELVYLEKNLVSVHDAFFAIYDQRVEDAQRQNAGQRKGPSLRRVSDLKGETPSLKPGVADSASTKTDDLELVPYIKDIMPVMKEQVLEGVIICFTGILPQNSPHHYSDIGRWSISFGARVSPNLTKSTTHVVGDSSRLTPKLRQAVKHPHIKVVEVSWLAKCFSEWQRADETPFLIKPDPDDRPFEELPEDPLNNDIHALPSKTKSIPKIVLPEQDASSVEEPLLSPEQEDTFLDQLQLKLSPEDEAELAESDDDSDVDSVDTDGNKKAKEDNEMDDDVSDTESLHTEPYVSDSESDAPLSEDRKRKGNWPESDLQKRKKRALERTTSLTNMTRPESEDEQNDEEEDDDLEAMMLAAFEYGA